MADIHTIQEGRELDALVAEKVMGITLVADPWDDHDYCYREDGELLSVAPYSTSIAAAWQVVEKLKNGSPVGVGFSTRISYWPADTGEEWIVSFGCNTYPDKGNRIVEATASTAPLAICRAALCVVTEER